MRSSIDRRRVALLLTWPALCAGLVLVAVRVGAQGVPETDSLNYTGHLETPDGNAVTGAKNIALSLHDAEQGGTTVCEAPSREIILVGGRFDVVLPDECADAVAGNPDLWIQIEVDGSSLGRSKVGAVPYALEASHSTDADRAMTATEADRASSADRADSANYADAVATRSGEDQVTFSWDEESLGAYVGETVVALAAARSLTKESVMISTDCTYTSLVTDCKCGTGYVAIGGGACTGVNCGAAAGSALVESKSMSTTTWRISCEDASGTRVKCGGPSVVCLRIVP